ncbi:pyruvate ferredoxin oxidoreductase subunit gamma [Methanocaldococcus indicus]|uniref:pyruvate ferredoxin oxidoreductase subunit gamma n=1 Tax=Methanocaldococcus indicus TaxID=213231 RepID=UPI003C6D5E0F
MIEVRFHGRGGQGVVTAAQLLAYAAFYDGKYSQTFPFFGVERRGAPVMAFTRIDKEKILLRCQVYEPDYVVVQDSSLLGIVNILEGLKKDGVVVINTVKKKDELNLDFENVYTIDATKIALDVLGVPIVNTAMIGALAGITKIVSLDGIKKAIYNRFPEKLAEKNYKAAEIAYKEVSGE